MEFPRQYIESQTETKASLHTERTLAAPLDTRFEEFIRRSNGIQELTANDSNALAPAFADKRSPEGKKAKKYDDAAAFEWAAWVFGIYGFIQAFIAATLANAGKTIAMTTVLGVSVPWWWPIAAAGVVVFVTATLVRRYTKARLEKTKNAQPAGVRSVSA